MYLIFILCDHISLHVKILIILQIEELIFLCFYQYKTMEIFSPN